MSATVRIEPASSLPAYAGVPIAFTVDRVLDVSTPNGGLGGIVLTERALGVPYVKDYDAADGGPAAWADRFDLSRWALFGAFVGERRVGVAAVARGVEPALGPDVALLWDLRVAPEARGGGVGSALFRAAGAWAEAHACRRLAVETQNVNVPACRFYAREGCVLGAVDRFAYPDLPDEVRLLWSRALPSL